MIKEKLTQWKKNGDSESIVRFRRIDVDVRIVRRRGKVFIERLEKNETEQKIQEMFEGDEKLTGFLEEEQEMFRSLYNGGKVVLGVR